MAQALLERMAAEQGLADLQVRSAGLAADAGAEASRFAQQALLEVGIDLTDHRAQMVDADLVEWADLILTMTRRHQEALVSAYPAAQAKVQVLKEYLISDSQRQQQEAALFALYQQMMAKKEAFAAEVQPNIAQLRSQRAALLQELAEVEQLLAERQAELLERLRPEREKVERIERCRSSNDILDPFGQPLETYRACRDELRSALSQLVAQIQAAQE